MNWYYVMTRGGYLQSSLKKPTQSYDLPRNYNLRMTEAVSPIEHILQQIGELDREGKEVIFEVLEKRIIEERRTEIAESKDETMKAYHQGTLKSGSPDDLFADLDI